MSTRLWNTPKGSVIRCSAGNTDDRLQHVAEVETCRMFIESEDGRRVFPPSDRHKLELSDLLRIRDGSYPRCSVVVWRGEHTTPVRHDSPDWGKPQNAAAGRTVYAPRCGQREVWELVCQAKPSDSQKPKSKKKKASKKIRWP